MRPLFLKVQHYLIPYALIESINTEALDKGHVTVFTKDKAYIALGNDAIEVIMAVKPSALEGRRLKWNKNAWMVHNLIGHPLMQLLAMVGLKHAAIRVHDSTVPRPRNG